LNRTADPEKNGDLDHRVRTKTLRTLTMTMILTIIFIYTHATKRPDSRTNLCEYKAS